MHFYFFLPFEASLQTSDRFLVIDSILHILTYYHYFMSIILVHDAFISFIDYIFCPNYLASTFKYSPGLLIWPDVDEGDLMDEEFDSESDA